MSSMWRPSRPLSLLLESKLFEEIKSTQRPFSGPHHFIPIEITFLLMSLKHWCLGYGVVVVWSLFTLFLIGLVLALLWLAQIWKEVNPLKILYIVLFVSLTLNFLSRWESTFLSALLLHFIGKTGKRWRGNKTKRPLRVSWQEEVFAYPSHPQKL